jgi:hypothetical protein
MAVFTEVYSVLQPFAHFKSVLVGAKKVPNHLAVVYEICDVFLGLDQLQHEL